MLDDTSQTADRKTSSDAAITVFFDGQCPMCRREIDYYRRLPNLSPIEWVDIADDTTDTSKYGLDRNLAMIRFHVRDRQGQWHTGAWGFVELWRHLPGWRWLARVLTFSRLVPLADRVYARVTQWRLQKKCISGACEQTR